MKNKKSIFRVLFLNLNGIYCPECSLLNNKPTAAIKYFKDKVYKKDKFYIKCKYCKTATPAYEDVSKIFDIWDDLFIKKEHQLFESEEQ